MKKLLLIGLMFSASGVIRAGTIIMQNNLKLSQLSNIVIECIVTDKNGTSKNILIKEGQTESLGNISAIARVECAQNVTSVHPMGRYSPSGYTYERFRSFDNITPEFLAATKGHEGDDFRVIVDWKYPGSYTSREWKYTFENLSRY